MTILTFVCHSPWISSWLDGFDGPSNGSVGLALRGRRVLELEAYEPAVLGLCENPRNKDDELSLSSMKEADDDELEVNGSDGPMNKPLRFSLAYTSSLAKYTSNSLLDDVLRVMDPACLLGASPRPCSVNNDWTAAHVCELCHRTSCSGCW